MEPIVSITADPAMTGPEPSTAPAPEAVPETTPDTPDAAPETTPDTPDADGKAEKPTTEAAPTFTLPDGTKATAAEIAAWKAGSMMEADYRRKTQELADQRREFEERGRADDAARRAAEQARQPARIDPIDAADQWKQLRYQQYVDHYRSQGRDANEVDWRDIEMDHIRASQNVMVERDRQTREQFTQRERAADVERQTVWLDRTIETHLNDEKFKLANTPEGHEDVRAHLAAVLHATGEITAADIQAAVAKVHSRANAYVGRYVNGKQQQAQKTAGVTKGGGQSRAPERKKYAPELDSIRELSNDLERGG